jgi:hypothetical protein
MDENEFRVFMKKQGRSWGTIEKCVELTKEFEEFLQTHRNGIALEGAQPADLEAFIDSGEKALGSANSYLWGIGRYYEFTRNDDMRKFASRMRQQKIEKRRPKHKGVTLKNIQGADPGHVGKLAALGIKDTQALLDAGCTPEKRRELSGKSGIPVDDILSLVKMADLTRIVDIKGVRVRLLFDSGIDTVEKVAMCDPKALRERLIEVNEEKEILKRHPTLVETTYWVTQAKELPRVLEFGE